MSLSEALQSLFTRTAVTPDIQVTRTDYHPDTDADEPGVRTLSYEMVDKENGTTIEIDIYGDDYDEVDVRVTPPNGHEMYLSLLRPRE